MDVHLGLLSEVIRIFDSERLLGLRVEVDWHSSLGVVVSFVECLVGAHVLGSELDVTTHLLVPASGSVGSVGICREREARSRIGTVSVAEHHVAELVRGGAGVALKAVAAVRGGDDQASSTVSAG